MTDNEKRAHDIALRTLVLQDFELSILNREANGAEIPAQAKPIAEIIVNRYNYVYQTAIKTLNSENFKHSE